MLECSGDPRYVTIGSDQSSKDQSHIFLGCSVEHSTGKLCHTELVTCLSATLGGSAAMCCGAGYQNSFAIVGVCGRGMEGGREEERERERERGRGREREERY